MNELININYENSNRPTVMGRELHKALGVKEKYSDWFKRMCEYGFAENEDFSSFLIESSFSEIRKNPIKAADRQSITN